ncbi:MAG: alpha/beta hydrolase [Rhodospirillaceae bacterium]|nr:alpha/beta hydrolase [Rhodospirillaceae bacterium]
MPRVFARRIALMTATCAPFASAPASAAAPVRRAYAPAWTGQVHLREAGTRGQGRRALMCFHPSLASSLYYEPLLAEMGQDRFVVAPDIPGYGMSDAPPAQPTVADYARAMADAADALGLADFDILGAHTGAKIGVELALLRPAQVRHLAMVGAPVYTEADLKRLRERNAVEPPDPDGAFLVRAWKSQVERRDPRAGLADVMRRFPDHLIGGDARIWGQVAAFSYHMDQRIGAVAAPVLVINPRGDLSEPTKRVAPYLKSGKLVDRPDWAPSFLQHDTAAAAAMLRAFFDEDRFPE